ncbi:MAG: hypothetical protein GY788_32380 [bacterium]|nr:hypothetical protein [bacterium]
MAFDHIIAYEDRDEIFTSRWLLDGVITKDGTENIATDGMAWFSASASGDTLTITVYADAAGSGDIATGTASVAAIALAATKVTLAQANSSGISGELWVEEYTSAVTLAPMKVSLVMDTDLSLEYQRIEQAHMDSVYHSTNGYAEYCAAATKEILNLATSLFKEQMGGYGTKELRYLLADRITPDWRTIVQPGQYMSVAKYWALWKICYAACEGLDENDVMWQKAEYFRAQYEDAKASLHPTFDTDNDGDADESASASIIHLERV